MRLIKLYATCAILGFCASAAEISCVKELELPRFATAGRSPRGGTVVALVELGGVSPRISVSSRPKDKSLEEEVRYHLRERGKYDMGCKGKVELRFTFAVEGDPSYSPFPRVFFKPPNAFIIITQPLQSSENVIPLNKQ